MKAFLESTFGLLFEKGGNYSKTTIELYKLKLAEQSANLVSFLLISIMYLLLFFLVVVMISIGLSLLIGELVGKNWLGFLIVSLINIAFSFLLFNYRNRLVKAPITKLMVKVFEISIWLWVIIMLNKSSKKVQFIKDLASNNRVLKV